MTLYTNLYKIDKSSYLYISSLSSSSPSKVKQNHQLNQINAERKNPTKSEKGREEEIGVRMAGLMDKAKGFVTEKIAHMPKPEASLTTVSLKNLTRECITLHSEVAVSNPYSHRLPICDISFSLKSVDKVIASGQIPDPGWIAANDNTKLEIPMKVPYDFLISIMKDIGRDWDIDYILEVGLTVDLPVLGNFTIPLSSKGEFKLPTLKDLF
ncbi:hypothetical protein LUZ60_008462 [Juncus effusus]|nr:hypothetical protein LUZ60_008462 [Juncus effusus]